MDEDARPFHVAQERMAEPRPAGDLFGIHPSLASLEESFAEARVLWPAEYTFYSHW